MLKKKGYIRAKKRETAQKRRGEMRQSEKMEKNTGSTDRKRKEGGGVSLRDWLNCL